MKHVVIDLGSSHVLAMAAEVTADGRVHIHSVEQSARATGVKYGYVEQPATAAYAMGEAVRLLQNSAGMGEVPPLCVSLNAKTMKCCPVHVTRLSAFPRLINQSLLDEMWDECSGRVQQSEVEVYDTIPLCYMLDGVCTDNPVHGKGRELVGHYNLVVGHHRVMEQLQRCFDRAPGLNLHDYVPLGVEALARVLLDKEERECGCALINLGATTTTLAVYHEDALRQLVVVPLGSDHITHDLCELGISEANAAKLKLHCPAQEDLVTRPVRIKIPGLHAGDEPVVLGTDFVAKCIEMRLVEILSPVVKSLRALDFEVEAGIVLAGGAAKQQGLVELLERETALPVRLGSHMPYLTQDTDPRFADPQYAQSVGTVLLLHDYEEDRPVEEKNEPVKPPAPPRKGKWSSLGDKIKTGLGGLFDDDNYLRE